MGTADPGNLGRRPVAGYALATLDIDIFIRPTFSNAEKTRKALAAFGYDLTDVSVDGLLKKKLLIRQCRDESIGRPRVILNP